MKNTLYISFFLLLVLLIWSAVSSIAKPVEVRVVPTGGIVDVSGMDFTRTVFNCNSFDSYPQKLYTPLDFDSGAVTEAPTALVLADYRHIDYATHVMRVTLTPGRIYGVFMRSADYAMRLFINGEEVEPVGWPGDTKETTVPRVAERVYYFKPDTNIATIVMQVSNFVHREGAYPALLRFGSYENITRYIMVEWATAMLIMGCLLTAALYHFGLFCLNRGRKIALIFSVCCLLLAMMNNKVIPFLFPEYNWYAVFRLEYVVHFTVFGLLTFFLDSLYPVLFHKRVTRVYYGVCALFILSTFVFDTKTYSALILYFEAVSISLIMYLFIKMALSLKGGGLKTALSFIGIIIVGLFGINDMLFHIGISFVGNIGGLAFTTPVAMVFFVFCYSLVLSIENAETERAMRDAQEREHALAEQNAMMDRLSKIRAEFMAGISHEMKMPLTVMSGYAQLTGAMLERGLNNQEMRSNLSRITDEAERLAGIVSQLLQITRIQENKASLCPVNLQEAVRETVDAYNDIITATGNRLLWDTAPGLPPVMADKVMLAQVLGNLLSNANAHTVNGEIKISIESDPPFACVSVTDNGCGIPPDMLAHVFERYKTGRDDGTGLGLAICKEIIGFHGGDITITSEPGNGTAVRFTLPFAEGGGADE